MRPLCILLILSAMIMYSCTSTPDGMMDEGDRSMITTAEYDALARACQEDEHHLILTQPLTEQSNYISNEHTLEIYTIVLLSEQFRLGLANVLFPPTDAIIAEIDGIYITAGDTAYEWGLDGDRYVYLLTDEGYQITYYEQGALTGREMIWMTQSEDCDQVSYTQYVVEADAGKPLGSIEFQYEYNQAGTAKIVYFGDCISDPNSPSYNVRIFEDLSGELETEQDGNVVKRTLWNPDGSGSYQLLENGAVVDAGSWTL